jgi:hypothetical protein
MSKGDKRPPSKPSTNRHGGKRRALPALVPGGSKPVRVREDDEEKAAMDSLPTRAIKKPNRRRCG